MSRLDPSTISLLPSPQPPKATPEVRALLNQARKASQARDFQTANPLYEQALAKARELKDRPGEAETLLGQGLVYRYTGQPSKALAFFNQALSIYRETGDKGGEAYVFYGIGNVYKETDQPQKALEFFNQALPLHRTVGNKRGEIDTLGSLGIVYDHIGQFQKALEFYNQALSLSRLLGDKQSEARWLFNIGLVYQGIGQPSKALEFFNQALPLYREIGDKLGETGVLAGMGTVYYDQMGQSKKALELFTQALPLYRAVGDKRREGGMLVNIGNIYRGIGQPQKALEYYQQALPVLRALGNRQFEANALANIGIIYRDTGEPQKALEYFNLALPIYQETVDKRGEANTLGNMANAELRLNQTLQAEAHYAQAVALYETLRENIGGLSEAKASFLGSIIITYYSYLTFLLDQGKAVAAFELAQKTKARSLLDLMESGRIDLSSELTPDERRQELELRQKADTLNQAMVKEGVENEVGAKKRYAALKEEIKQTESQLQTFTDTLYSRHPRLAPKRVAKTATLAEIAKLLPADTALLDYIVLSKDNLALFVVTQKGVQALILPLAYKGLASKASAFRTACADPRKEYKPVAAELYTQLLAPATKQLAGVKRLVICPDGALWDVPFAALLSGGQFLAQRYELAYAYSATGAQAALTVKASRKKPTQTLLALANPDFGSSKRFGDLDNLPGQRPIDTPSRPIDTPSRPIDTPSRPIDTPSRPIDTPSRPIDSPSRAFDSVSRGKAIAALPGTQREADALKKLFPRATLMTGKAAQEAKAKVEATKFRYLHFATHGFFNDASPLLSSLVLAQPSTARRKYPWSF